MTKYTKNCTTMRNEEWTNLAPMHQPRESFAAVSHRNCIYVFGGSTLRTVEVYDVNSNAWTKLPSMKEARMSPGCVVIDDIIYVVGGLDSKNRPLKSIEVFDTTSCKWREGTLKMKQGRVATVIAIEKALYIIGDKEYIEIYKPDLGTWEVVPDEYGADHYYCLPSIHYSHNTGKLLIFGGAKVNTIIPIVRTFNVRHRVWDSFESKLATWAHGTAVYDDNILFVGGTKLSIENLDCNFNMTPLDSTMLYNLKDGSWAPHAIPSMTSRRHANAAVTIGESLFVLGGRNESGVLDSLVCLKLKNFLAGDDTSTSPRLIPEDSSTACLVCMDKPKSHAFVPCGHLSICGDCASKFPQSHSRQSRPSNRFICPVCRNMCHLIMKVYG